MEMKKNDRFVLKIEDMGENGEGIGRLDGYIWFVKDAVIGDVIEAGVTKMKKQYGFARLIRVIEPSEYRTEERCPSARRCGGCQDSGSGLSGTAEAEGEKGIQQSETGREGFPVCASGRGRNDRADEGRDRAKLLSLWNRLSAWRIPGVTGIRPSSHLEGIRMEGLSQAFTQGGPTI